MTRRVVHRRVGLLFGRAEAFEALNFLEVAAFDGMLEILLDELQFALFARNDQCDTDICTTTERKSNL